MQKPFPPPRPFSLFTNLERILYLFSPMSLILSPADAVPGEKGLVLLFLHPPYSNIQAMMDEGSQEYRRLCFLIFDFFFQRGSGGVTPERRFLLFPYSTFSFFSCFAAATLFSSARRPP